MSPSELPARPAGDPAPDVIAMEVAHRMMRADLARLAALTAQVAARRTPCSPRRATGIAEYVELLCDSIQAHHALEDDVLWPVISASAGACVDLAELREDHAARAHEALRGAAAAFRAHPRAEDTASALALRLHDLHALLDEHVEDEERVVFPVIRSCVTAQDWRAVERAASGRLSFELPRTFDHTTAEERVRLVGAVGARVLQLAALVLVPLYRRRERLVFGG